MNRRSCIEWLTRSLAAACAAVIALPGVRYVVGAVRKPETQGEIRRRVARLYDLPVGRPHNLAITGKRRDAWTTYPVQPIAQVWLLRQDGDAVPPAECRVAAFSSECPHLRCRVQMDGAQNRFFCPCHRGAFDLKGAPVAETELGHHNPAPRALDQYPCRIVADDRGEWWVEVAYPA